MQIIKHYYYLISQSRKYYIILLIYNNNIDQKPIYLAKTTAEAFRTYLGQAMPINYFKINIIGTSKVLNINKKEKKEYILKNQPFISF